MDKIICVVGASGSGKTTIAKELEYKGYDIIHSYTTREPREQNEWGHIFVKRLPKKKSNIFAFQEVYEGIYYWATREQYQGKGYTIYVVDPKGAIQCKEKVKDAEVISIFLDTPATTRAKRMVWERSPMDTIARLKSDKVVFRDVVTDYTLDGSKSIPELVGDIIQIIEGGSNYE